MKNAILKAQTWEWLPNFFTSTSESTTVVVPGLSSESEFYDSLHIEKARADRTELPLSMVIFWEVSNSKSNGHNVMGKLVKVLKRRIRCTDILGSFDTDKVGLLLPHTNADHTWELLKDVYARLSSICGGINIDECIFYRVHSTDHRGDIEEDGFLS